MASAYLTRTNGTSTEQKIFTFSAWVKRSAISTSGDKVLMAEYTDSNNRMKLQFKDDDFFEVYQVDGGNIRTQVKTNRKFRDSNGWYHMLIVGDNTQGTNTNRLKIYVNGVQETSFSVSTYPYSSTIPNINENSKTITIGNDDIGGSYFDGLMTHVNFVDGTALTPTSFGQSDSNGVWIPKPSPSVTYGTNGFFLKMDNSGNMGLDSSGNSNNFTTSGTITQAKDTPSNVFNVLNTLDTSRGLSNGNTTYAGASAGTVVKGTLAVNSGKWYAECKIVDASENMIGVLDIGQAPTTNYVGHSAVGWGIYTGDGNLYNNSSSSSYSSAFSDNDIMGIALDMDNNKLYFSKNGVWQNSGVPTSGSTGTGAISITSGLTMTFCGGRDNASDTASFNFGNGYFGTTAVTSAGTNASGNGIFEYDVPTGYTALSTKGLNS